MKPQFNIYLAKREYYQNNALFAVNTHNGKEEIKSNWMIRNVPLAGSGWLS